MPFSGGGRGVSKELNHAEDTQSETQQGHFFNQLLHTETKIAQSVYRHLNLKKQSSYGKIRFTCFRGVQPCIVMPAEHRH